MSLVTIIGTIAALCSTISFAPQAWKIIQTRETKDISLGMYLFTVTGFAAWLTARGLGLLGATHVECEAWLADGTITRSRAVRVRRS